MIASKPYFHKSWEVTLCCLESPSGKLWKVKRFVPGQRLTEARLFTKQNLAQFQLLQWISRQ